MTIPAMGRKRRNRHGRPPTDFSKETLRNFFSLSNNYRIVYYEGFINYDGCIICDYFGSFTDNN